jgi:hypothetical protein
VIGLFNYMNYFLSELFKFQFPKDSAKKFFIGEYLPIPKTNCLRLFSASRFTEIDRGCVNGNLISVKGICDLALSSSRV